MRLIRDFMIGLMTSVWFVLALVPAVSAHDPGTWFDLIGWDNHHDIDYKIDDSIPGSNGSNFEDRIHDGADHWNAVTGVDGFTFDDNGNDSTGWVDACNWEDLGPVDIRVFYRDLTNGIPGQTQRCERYDFGLDVYYITAARVAFNSDETWYKGTGNVPANEVSVEEVALHEFGHATGTFRGGAYGGHWPPEPSFACAVGGAEADWTMCPVVTPGESYLLPLEPHDIDTFQNAY